MALPVRPPVWPAAPTGGQPAKVPPAAADARAAAQKAFFDAALAGRTTTATAQAAQSNDAASARPTQSAAQAVRAVAAAEARAADRLPPPGSLVNILV